jgi:hypothetical protein
MAQDSRGDARSVQLSHEHVPREVGQRSAVKGFAALASWSACSEKDVHPFVGVRDDHEVGLAMAGQARDIV